MRLARAFKNIPKCMAPVPSDELERHVLDYVVLDECVAAGLHDFTIAISDNPLHQGLIKGNFVRDAEYEKELQAKGNWKALKEEEVLSSLPVRYAVQALGGDHPYGTAVPVGLCLDAMRADGVELDEHEGVVIITGDEFIRHATTEDADLKRLKDTVIARGTGGGMLVGASTLAEAKRGGLVVVSEANGQLRLREIIEHAAELPTNPDGTPLTHLWKSFSRYIASPEVLACIQEVLSEPPAANGEYQIIKGFNRYVERGGVITVLPISDHSEYVDCGKPESLTAARMGKPSN